MVTYAEGDVTAEESFANPVNLVGVMGKGLALQVARRWPDCRGPYKAACLNGKLSRGRVLAWPKPKGGWIFQTPTKVHWREPSTAGLVRASVRALLAAAARRGVHTVGVPRLGCGLGGLPWTEVRRIIHEEADPSPVTLRVYGAPRSAAAAGATRC